MDEEKIKALETRLAVQSAQIKALDRHLTVLSGLLITLAPKAAKALPATLMMAAQEVRAEGDDLAASLLEHTADQLVRTAPAAIRPSPGSSDA